jgi:hypothetical protein
MGGGRRGTPGQRAEGNGRVESEISLFT